MSLWHWLCLAVVLCVCATGLIAEPPVEPRFSLEPSRFSNGRKSIRSLPRWWKYVWPVLCVLAGVAWRLWETRSH